MSHHPFHLAITVNDLVAAENFYGKVLGCAMGRRADCWIDFNLYGHQLVCHLTELHIAQELPGNHVDGKQVPVPHFGVVLDWSEWETLAARLEAKNIRFIIEPTVRFAGQIGEQATMFFADPAGNMLEFKAMRDPDQLFAT
jgi:extradiol dioxygenase family protein